MERFIETMFLRHLARHFLRSKSSWSLSFLAAQYATLLWLGFAMVLVMTAILAALSGVLPRHLNPLTGPSWVWPTLWLPVFYFCNGYIKRITSRYKAVVSPIDLTQFNAPRERRIWLAESLSVLPVFYLAVWLWFSTAR